MKPQQNKKPSAIVKIEKLNDFKNTDLSDLCDATETTILDSAVSFNIGLKRSEPLVRERLEAYWKGVPLVAERVLIVGRLDGVIASSIQLIKPNPNNQTSKFSCSINHHFVAPWARGHGLAKQLLIAAEEEAKASGLSLIKLNVRADLDGAIKLYESCGYRLWGTLDKFEMIDGKMIAGHFYCKDL
jgi:ribosomal protein S18 acetylase RimI-like enzyme